MPIYEYKCSQCNFQFELLRRLNDTDDTVSCPQCSALDARRQHSVFSGSVSHGNSAGSCPGPGPSASCGAGSGFS